MTEFFNQEEALLLPENMLKFYAGGAFPMADEDNAIHWYYPEIRTVIPLNHYNIPRSLKKFLKSDPFTYRFDTRTMEVIRNCAEREETWISPKLIDAYNRLRLHGYIHSVEVYKNGELAGGLYGVSIKGAFFGESMFTRVSQASKAALVKLIEHLNAKKFSLLDVQYPTEHLKMFGAREIQIDDYDDIRIQGLLTDTSF